LDHAYASGYGSGAFNAHNAETVQAIIEAAKEEQSPIMIQVEQKFIQTLGMEPMKMLIDWYARNSSVPITKHLAHIRDFSPNNEGHPARFNASWSMIDCEFE